MPERRLAASQPYGGEADMSTLESSQGAADEAPLLRMGVPGLDDILGGGLVANRLYLLEGAPGAGKTTVALQFLREGAALNERVLYVTLSETEAELRGVALSHGWDLAGINLREMLPSLDALQPDEQYTMFHPSEVELGEATLRILQDVDQIKPARVVFDSLSELRLMAGDSLAVSAPDPGAEAVLRGPPMHRAAARRHDGPGTRPPGAEHRACGRAAGAAELRLRLHAAPADRREVSRAGVPRGLPRLQDRQGRPACLSAAGGLGAPPPAGPDPDGQRLAGASTTCWAAGSKEAPAPCVVGAPGTGKSTLAVQFVVAAAQRGECAALFIFDEGIATLRTRCEGMGMDLGPHIDSGRVLVRQVDPAELSPGELVHLIREAVTQHEATVVVIDSLNGYLNAMPDERFLIVQLHELLMYLGQAGVATLLVGAHHGLIGSQMQSPVDASYLADSIVLLRYFEAEGEVQQAISVVKKRGGAHERTIRAFSLTPRGIEVGEPLRHYRGILTGVPTRA